MASRASAGRPPPRQGRKFDQEIVPFTTKMIKTEVNEKKEVVRTWEEEVTLTEDEGIRADTTYEGVAKIRPALEGGVISAGNASQFSDGASMAVVMEAKLAEKRGLSPSASSRASRWRAASRTRWASARSSPCRSC